MVRGVADDRVPGLEDRPQAAEVRLVAGGEHERAVGSHPIRDLALELRVERSGPVQESRTCQAGAIRLERIACRRLHPRVAGQTQVVVGAEHHRLVPLDLHHGAGLGLDEPEIGKEVRLLRRFELLLAAVSTGLREHVHGGTGDFGHGESLP